MGVRDLRIRIAGDGPLSAIPEHFAKDLGLSESIEFVGAIHDIPAFLRRAQFLVHTSESEGCPNVVMEAMACERPMVAVETRNISHHHRGRQDRLRS